LSDFALRFGLAFVVVIAAATAVIISRRNYAKAANLERGIEAFRLEFRRSIDAAQAATIKSIAKTIHDNIFSVIKPIDSTVRDLDARIARLEQQHADATAAHVAGTQILNVRLARLEEHTDAGAIENLDVRIAKLEEHSDTATATATQIAATQKQSLEENERIAAQLVGLKQNLAALGDQQQNLTALSDQLSLIKQTIDEADGREQDIKNSIESINSRVLDAQTRADELLPRLLLGEKAHKDLGSLISLFVKRLKRVNANSTELALRLSDLECRFRLKATQLEERHILERADSLSTSNIEDLVKDAAPKAADGAGLIAAKTDGENARVFERPSPGGETSKEASVEGESRADNSRADQHAT
jgi:chromosome segregation ATPase